MPQRYLSRKCKGVRIELMCVLNPPFSDDGVCAVDIDLPLRAPSSSELVAAAELSYAAGTLLSVCVLNQRARQRIGPSGGAIVGIGA